MKGRELSADAAKKQQLRGERKTTRKRPPRFASLEVRKVTRTSVGEETTKQLMTLISSGQLKPGQRLPPERELCKSFGVGRSSIREALRCLSMVGILDARVGEGTTVAINGAKFIQKSFEWRILSEQRELESLMKVRIALEGAAAAEAAVVQAAPQLAHLDRLIKEMGGAQEDRAKFAKLDVDFHVTLAEASGDPLLYGLLRTIRSQLAHAMERVLPLPHALPHSQKEHVAIYRAVKKGDPQLARHKVQTHLEAALERYRQRPER